MGSRRSGRSPHFTQGFKFLQPGRGGLPYSLIQNRKKTMNAPLSRQQNDAMNRSERQSQVVRALTAVLPAHALLWNTEDTTPYECDGLTARGYFRL